MKGWAPEKRRNAARKVIGKTRMEAAHTANKGRKKPNRTEKAESRNKQELLLQAKGCKGKLLSLMNCEQLKATISHQKQQKLTAFVAIQ